MTDLQKMVKSILDPANQLEPEKKPDFPMPPSIREFVDRMIPLVRSNVEEYDQLMPVVFVSNSRTKEMVPIGGAFSTVADKEAFANYVRLFCQDIKADSTMFVSEAWAASAHGKTPEEANRFYRELIKKYGSVEKSPHRMEVVHMSVETVGHVWQGMAAIVPKKGNRPRTFFEVEFHHMVEHRGRFSQFLVENRIKE